MNETLLMVIYLLLIALIIVAIIVSIKFLFTLNKMEELLDDVKGKVKTLDKLFDVVDFASDKMTMITEATFGFISNTIKKIFGKKNKGYKEEIDNE